METPTIPAILAEVSNVLLRFGSSIPAIIRIQQLGDTWFLWHESELSRADEFNRDCPPEILNVWYETCWLGTGDSQNNLALALGAGLEKALGKAGKQ